MTKNQVVLQFAPGSTGNQLAIAIGDGVGENKFSSTNDTFAALFPGIQTPGQLRDLVTSQSDSKTILKFKTAFWEMMELEANREETLFLLKNISFEMMALTQLKEQLKELTHTHRLHSGILDKELPVGVMVIDKDYNVSFANHTLKRFFHIPARVNLKKCYNYVKGIKPCEPCILKSIQIDSRDSKRMFEADNGKRKITAEIHPMEDKYILSFRDTTKEIDLIKEIKKQQEALESANRQIAEQNDILKGLSNINVRIGQMKDMDAILETVMNAIIGTFGCSKGAILLFTESGKIKNACFTEQINEPEQSRIIQYVGISVPPRQVRDSKTGKPGTEAGADAVKENLKDYIVQDMFDKETFIGRIFLFQPDKMIDASILELFLMQVSGYLENLELQQKLEEVAQTDGLTGVFNRYYFDKRFEEERDLSLRFGQPLSLVLADVNGLKEINDGVGHEAGDMLLAQTALLLNSNIRESDSIYRIGGDEFVILLSNCPEEQLRAMTERLKEIQTAASFELNNRNFPIRFSLGGSCSTKTAHTGLKDEADKQMYLDKESYYKTHKKYR
ncbi:MAG: GGDEF domain-containing protein [bacterium]|nr:GGDEF domain-containing protein [bacterium]